MGLQPVRAQAGPLHDLLQQVRRRWSLPRCIQGASLGLRWQARAGHCCRLRPPQHLSLLRLRRGLGARPHQPSPYTQAQSRRQKYMPPLQPAAKPGQHHVVPQPYFNQLLRAVVQALLEEYWLM